MLTIFKAFLSDESGATAIEYGLITALIGVVAIAALSEMGDALAAVFGRITSVLNSQVPAAP